MPVITLNCKTSSTRFINRLLIKETSKLGLKMEKETVINEHEDEEFDDDDELEDEDSSDSSEN